MKNENTTTEAERIAKAFSNAAKAIGKLFNIVRKSEGGYVTKTHPLYGMPMVDWLAGMHEDGLCKKFHEKHNHELYEQQKIKYFTWI